ncbi:MAG: hypothetical protein ACYTG7_05835 [Planctomycetota bacterium]
MVCLLFFLQGGGILAAEPTIERMVYIMDGSDPLDAGRASVPFSVDWNNDGKKDLIVGVFDQRDNVWLFLNKGTDLQPVFAGKKNIESNGKPIIGSHG